MRRLIGRAMVGRAMVGRAMGGRAMIGRAKAARAIDCRDYAQSTVGAGALRACQVASAGASAANAQTARHLSRYCPASSVHFSLITRKGDGKSNGAPVRHRVRHSPRAVSRLTRDSENVVVIK